VQFAHDFLAIVDAGDRENPLAGVLSGGLPRARAPLSRHGHPPAIASTSPALTVRGIGDRLDD
jgi:hypothetical protein